MRFLNVGLSNYRNIEFARLNLDSSRVFIVGENGQGKTNLLEALGLATALRPFRTRETKKVIGPKGGRAEVAFDMMLEDYGEISSRIVLKRRGKEAYVDGESILRASDYVGRFPTVLLCSNDMQLLRGSPGLRRQYFDSFLCGVDRGYFIALRQYTQAVSERNALLKRGAFNASMLEAFEREIAKRGSALIERRQRALEELMPVAKQTYSELSGQNESLECQYQASLEIDDPEAYQIQLRRNREVDTVLKSTSKGPHRDDFRYSVNGMDASDYASEGQQRTCLIAMALSIIEYWRNEYEVAPVALTDDALTELDPKRKSRFWSILGEDLQVIATGTELPENAGNPKAWLTYEARNGSFKEVAADGSIR